MKRVLLALVLVVGAIGSAHAAIIGPIAPGASVGPLDPGDIVVLGGGHLHSGAVEFSDEFTFTVSQLSNIDAAILNFEVGSLFGINDFRLSLLEDGVLVNQTAPPGLGANAGGQLSLFYTPLK